jgi:catechol 2,3-dioxygenase-like lactoylglutathione lyase family enzyme
MTIQRLENVGIVVDDLAAATKFFVELGLKVLGEGPVEGGWVDRYEDTTGSAMSVARRDHRHACRADRLRARYANRLRHPLTRTSPSQHHAGSPGALVSIDDRDRSEALSRRPRCFAVASL